VSPSSQSASGADRLDTIPRLLLNNAKRMGDRIAMRHKDAGIWKSWTWRDLKTEIRDAAIGLRKLGFNRGERVAILGSNRPRLYWAMCAIQSLGGVPVPVYADMVADELAKVLAHAEVTFAIVEDQEQVDKIQSIHASLPSLEHVIYDFDRGMRDYDHARLHSFESLQKLGREELKSNPNAEKWWLEEIEAGKGSDVSVMLYTSGTTGQSKGVMISGERCIAAARATVGFDKLRADDTVLAYLPLAWVGDHYLNYAQAYVSGFCIACPESPETVQQDIREIGPSFYFAPPRVFEGMLTRVMIRMEDAGTLKRKIFHHYIGVAKKWGEKILNKEPVPFSAKMSYALGNALVYGPLKNVMGFSNIRIAYTAGEAIGPELFSFYRSLGLNLKQLYGQTEAFLYVTAQPDGQIKSDTVGPAVPGVDIKIDEHGEVLYRTQGQFVGYFKEPEKTAETITPEGYVRTGDAGFFGQDGHLRIIDRAKDVGKLTSGAIFSPKYLENRIKFFTEVKEAVAFGNGRDYVTMFLNIDLTSVGSWAERNNVSFASYQELAGHPRVLEIIKTRVDELNKSLALEPRMAASQVKRFIVLHKELDPDDGEITRTQKVRRSFVADRYAPLIKALYDGSSQASIAVEVVYEDGRKGRIEGTMAVVDMTIYPAAANNNAMAVKEAAE
jgi:long-chain acyl-CoA synthetase